MYSAGDEERIIEEYFGAKRGRYLDIGAFDGRIASNTRALLDRGWSGVAVEPNPEVFLHLRDEVAAYPVQCVNTGLGRLDAVKIFYHWPESQNALASGTFDVSSRDEARLVRGVGPAAEMYLPMTGVHTFFKTFPGPYDFLNLDAEGMDWEILPAMPVRMLGIRLLCVEYGQHYAQFEGWAKQKRFAKLWENDCNIIFERR